MSKRKIECRVETITKVQKIFEENNTLIHDNLKKFEKELDNMREVLYTPKSSKLYPIFKKYVEKEDKVVLEKGEWLNKMFNNIVNEYTNFENEVNNTVGGSNE